MKTLFVVDELPASKHPWILATYGDLVIAVNAEHDVRHYRNGERVEPDPHCKSWVPLTGKVFHSNRGVTSGKSSDE